MVLYTKKAALLTIAGGNTNKVKPRLIKKPFYRQILALRQELSALYFLQLS